MRLAALFALCIATLLAWPGTAAAADARRGRILYESHCGNCHAESVHSREKRVASDFEAVRTWVRRWSDSLGLGWTDAEVNDVTVHLNERYYRFACPPADCRALTGIGQARGRLALDGRPR